MFWASIDVVGFFTVASASVKNITGEGMGYLIEECKVSGGWLSWLFIVVPTYCKLHHWCRKFVVAGV